MKTEKTNLLDSNHKTKIGNVEFSKLETALLDEMSDGQWHAKYKLYKGVKTVKKQSVQSLKNEIDNTLAHLTDIGWVKSGNNESYRLLGEKLNVWRNMSTTLDKNDKRYMPRYFGGILEDDGWEKAPLYTYDMIHFRVENISLSGVKQLLFDANYESIQADEDNLIRVFTFDGEGLYNMMQQVKADCPELKVYGLRREKDLRRRNMKELPEVFVSELCQYYGKFAKVLLRSYMSSITKHISDKDDIQQQIYIWIIEAIQRYDSETSIPFAAYLANSLKKWVFNLSRKSYGRAVADAELKYSRAINDFKAENSRDPNNEELAALLESDEQIVTKDKIAINTVFNLRNISTIHAEEGEAEMPIVSAVDTESQLDQLVENTLISASVTTASLQFKNSNDGLRALLAIYYKTWGENVKSKKVYNFLKQPNVQKVKNKALKDSEQILREALGHD